MSDPQLPSTSDDNDVDVKPSKEAGKWRQYYTSFVMFVVCISNGLSYGWSSPMIQILEKDISPVGKMDSEQITILQMIPQIAGVFGTIFVAFTLVKFGTKVSGYVQALIMIGGWLGILLANTPFLLYVGRFFVGMAQVSTVGSFYLSEVVHDCRRGTLISAAMFGISLGALTGYFLGSFCGWVAFNTACVLPAVVFLFLLLPVPETPSFLARVGRINDAATSYAWFYGMNPGTTREKVVEMLAIRQPEISLKSLFTVKSNRNAVIILTFILGYAPLSGTTVVASYSSKIFETARSTIPPNTSALMVAIVSFIASLICTSLIDRLGRRFLIISSLGIMSLALSAVAAYFILEEGIWTDIPSKEPLLYVGMGAYHAACTVGVWGVSSTIGAELVPGGIKGILWMVSGTVCLLMSMLTFQIYALLTTHLPYYVYFIQAAGFCFVSVIIAWAIVPETKGKSMAQITAELSGLPFPDSESPEEPDTFEPSDNNFSDREPIIS